MISRNSLDSQIEKAQLFSQPNLMEGYVSNKTTERFKETVLVDDYVTEKWDEKHIKKETDLKIKKFAKMHQIPMFQERTLDAKDTTFYVNTRINPKCMPEIVIDPTNDNASLKIIAEFITKDISINGRMATITYFQGFDVIPLKESLNTTNKHILETTKTLFNNQKEKIKMMHESRHIVEFQNYYRTFFYE